jgi:hypothetical protein
MPRRDDASCPIVSTMKRVTQDGIIPRRMTINSILIRVTREIVDHDLTADRERGEALVVSWRRIKANL